MKGRKWATGLSSSQVVMMTMIQGLRQEFLALRPGISLHVWAHKRHSSENVIKGHTTLCIAHDGCLRGH